MLIVDTNTKVTQYIFHILLIITLRFYSSIMAVCQCYSYPAANYIFKVSKRNTRTRCELYSKLTIKTLLLSLLLSFVFTVNFEHILHLVSHFSHHLSSVNWSRYENRILDTREAFKYGWVVLAVKCLSYNMTV